MQLKGTRKPDTDVYLDKEWSLCQGKKKQKNKTAVLWGVKINDVICFVFGQIKIQIYFKTLEG